MALSSRLLRRLRVFVAGLMLAMVATIAAPPGPSRSAVATSLRAVACLVRGAPGGAVAAAAVGPQLDAAGAADADASRTRRHAPRATRGHRAAEHAVPHAHHERPPRSRGFVITRRLYVRNATLLR